jgi:hypothetical protein
MEIRIYEPKELNHVLRVLRTALRPAGPLEPAEARFLETWSRIADAPPRDGPEPAPIKPADVRIDGAHRRKRLVQLAAVAALLSHPVRADSARFVRDLAEALGVEEPVIPVLAALASGRTMAARVLTLRRMMKAMLKEAWLAEGLAGLVRFLAGVLLRARVNTDNLWSHKRLGLLPEGTLGRQYWAHMTRLGYGMPGESGGIPESVAYHDVGHVLAGHDTTPAGEILQGCFQGGNRREDGFFFIQFAILQFHQGVRLTPVAKPEVGYFEPAKVLWAIHRGASMAVDITHQWDYWPLMPLTLDEARRQCSLLPALEA